MIIKLSRLEKNKFKVCESCGCSLMINVQKMMLINTALTSEITEHKPRYTIRFVLFDKGFSFWLKCLKN